MGNAVIDAVATVTEAELRSTKLTKGQMCLVDSPSQIALSHKLKTAHRSGGGSVANVSFACASAGAKCAFIGTVGADELGTAFATSMEKITLSPAPKKGKTTAHCLVLVTPDGERTMQTFIGASFALTKADIDANLVRQSKVVCLEGYLWSSGVLPEVARLAVGDVFFMLSDAGLVKSFRKPMVEFLRKFSPAIIANEAEANALANTDNLAQAIRFIKTLSPLAVITRSHQGSVICYDPNSKKLKYKPSQQSERGGEPESPSAPPQETQGKTQGDTVITVPAVPTNKLVDSTGAGDIYAAGFIHSYIQNLPLKTCGNIASHYASDVLSQYGGRMKLSPL